MSNPTIVFDPYAAADLRNVVQTIVDNHNIALTGRAEWYPVAFFLKDERGEVLGGLLGDIWAAWLYIGTLGVAAPMRGRGFGRELMKQAELYAVERHCTARHRGRISTQPREKRFALRLPARVGTRDACCDQPSAGSAVR